MNNDYPFTYVCHPCVKKLKEKWINNHTIVFCQEGAPVTFKRRCVECDYFTDCFGLRKEKVRVKSKSKAL